MSKKEKQPEHSCCGEAACECDNNSCECHEADEVAILNDKLIRLQAELINYRRRKEEETARMLKYQGEDLIKALLPIVDDFERAIKMDDDNLTDELSKFLSGFKMMYGNLENIFISNEIKAIDCLHQPFDPHYHQAVLTDKNEAYDSGIVTEVLTKGYTYKDKVIRPAMVKVNE